MQHLPATDVPKNCSICLPHLLIIFEVGHMLCKAVGHSCSHFLGLALVRTAYARAQPQERPDSRLHKATVLGNSFESASLGE